MNQLAKVDQALDEMLVELGGMVLRLSSPRGDTFTIPSVESGAVATKNSCCCRIHAVSASSMPSKTLPMRRFYEGRFRDAEPGRPVRGA